MEKPVFRKVEENTEYIVVEMFSLPKSLGNSLGTAYTGAVCIKVDADINDMRLR